MSPRQSYRLCFCSECIALSGFNSEGIPNGNPILISLWDTHTYKVLEGDTTGSTAPVSIASHEQPFSYDIDGLTADLGGLSVGQTPSLPRRNHATVKTEKVLKAIQREVKACMEQINLPSSPLHLIELCLKARELSQSFNKVNRSTPALDQLKCDVKTELDLLLSSLDASPKMDAENSEPVDYDCDHYYNQAINKYSALVQIALILPTFSHIVFGISIRGADFLLGCLLILLRTVFFREQPMNIINQSVLKDIPKHIRTVLDCFNISGDTTVYAVCPACKCTYKPSSPYCTPDTEYPSLCSNQTSASTICNERLLESRFVEGVESIVPIQTFVYYEFKDWLARMLSRKEIEAFFDKACDDAMLAVDQDLKEFQDVFDGYHIRTFKFRDRLFIDRGSECRCLLGFNADFFNVNQNKDNGAKTSTGIIAMACLNLPVTIRYKPENMYLCGIIPGPKEPKETAINHFLRPIISDLLESWNRGVRLSRTASDPNGRIVRCAIGNVVCDLVAARQVAAHAPHNSHRFCSICLCEGRSQYGRTDWDTWDRRDLEETRLHATQWKDAGTESEREGIYKQHSVRYSELWRLPYWDPTRLLVVDPMHNLLEGLIQRHFRHQMALTTIAAKEADRDKRTIAYNYPFLQVPAESPLNTMERAQVTRIHHNLITPASELNESNLHTKLKQRHLRALQFVTASLNLVIEGGLRDDHARSLANWRTNMPKESSSYHRNGTNVMDHIRAVIRNTNVPSWLCKVPRDFGDKTVGTLKAEEWRALSAVYFPIALVTLWGLPDPGNDESEKCLETLDNTMHLLSAVRLACCRRINPHSIESYRSHMVSYLSGLHKIYPNVHFVGNHHMALHIPEFMYLYGPVHSWWCFPYERLIQRLQRIPTNNIFGQLEGTITYRFIMYANLRGWLARPDAPLLIQKCYALYTSLFGHDEGHEFRPKPEEDNISADEPVQTKQSEVPFDLKCTLHKTEIGSSNTIALFNYTKLPSGVTASTWASHNGNSLILFRASEDTAQVSIPGRIKYIFKSDRIQLAVQRYLPLPLSYPDPFSRYPDFPGKMYFDRLSASLKIIELSWIKCHFARYPMSGNMVVVSLSRND